MSLGKRSVAEFLGTFWLVLCGCASAVLAAAFPGLGLGFGGLSLAFGLAGGVAYRLLARPRSMVPREVAQPEAVFPPAPAAAPA